MYVLIATLHCQPADCFLYVELQLRLVLGIVKFQRLIIYKVILHGSITCR